MMSNQMKHGGKTSIIYIIIPYIVGLTIATICVIIAVLALVFGY